MRTTLITLMAAALFCSACGGDDDAADVSGDNVDVDDTANDDDAAAGGDGGASSGGGADDSAPFAAISAMANLPHGVGPVGVDGECSAAAGAFRFTSSGDTRFNIVIFDGSPPTVEAAQALIGTSIYTFVTIDEVEADADRYFISGTGAETGSEDDAGPMSFTILCRN